MQKCHSFQVEFTLKTPAKATLCWDVLSKRPDGFHEVAGVLVGLALYDEIHLTRTTQQGVTLVCNTPFDLGASQDNLVTKAAHAFAKASGIPSALHITLNKRIPVGAGLGGGSGNAAGVLQGLNHLHETPLKAHTLQALAAELGCDVPFFLHPSPSWARGRGEQLQPLAKPFPQLALLLVKPPVSISTATAYGWITPAEHAPSPPPTWHSLKQVCAALSNPFEATAMLRYPVLGQVHKALRQQGALGVVMSGTGSTMLGVFEHPYQCHSAQANLARQHPDWWITTSHVLP